MQRVALQWLYCGLLALAGVASAQPRRRPNPLLVESCLPFNYPPFDMIRNEHFLPAIEQGMAELTEEVEAIAGSTDTPTFDNTIVALERATPTHERRGIFFNLTSANTNPEMQEVQRTVAPELAAHTDAILLDPRRSARRRAPRFSRHARPRSGIGSRLLWRYHHDFVRAGARLPEASKAKLRALNTELATLQTAFEQNVLKEREASAVVFDTREELAGLNDASITEAAEAAKAAGKASSWSPSSTPPARRRDGAGEPRAREKLMAASLARGSRGGEFDNRAVVAAIASKRAERAALLGYPNHAAFQLEDARREASTGSTRSWPGSRRRPSPTRARRPRDAGRVDAEKGGFKPTPPTGPTSPRRCARPTTPSTSRSASRTTS